MEIIIPVLFYPAVVIVFHFLLAVNNSLDHLLLVQHVTTKLLTLSSKCSHVTPTDLSALGSPCSVSNSVQDSGLDF